MTAAASAYCARSAGPLPLKKAARSPLDRWAIPLLILIPLAVLWRVCLARFTIWDDTGTIQFNTDFLPPTATSMWHQWTAPNGALYIPVTQTIWGLISWATQYTDASGQIVQTPWPFHATNLLIHLIAVVTVFRTLRFLQLSAFGCFCGALLFAIHPVQVEAVAWASGLKDVLAGALGLLAVQQYLLYAGQSAARASRAHYFWAFAAFVAATLAKPSAMTLPLCVAVIDRLAIVRPWRAVFVSAGPWLIVAIPVAVIARLVQDAPDSPQVALWARPFIAGDSIVFYLGKLIWPVHLAVDYGHSPTFVIQRGQCYWNWLIPVSIAIALVAGRRRRPLLLLSGLLFLLGCLPVLGLAVSSFQYTSTTADHYLYFSMFGVALAVAWVLTAFSNAIVRWIASLALLACCLLSYRQTAYWKDNASLWSHELAVNPVSWVAFLNFGLAFNQDHDYFDAHTAFERAAELASSSPLEEEVVDEYVSTALRDDGLLNDLILEKRRILAIDHGVPTLHRRWAKHTAELGILLCETGRYSEALGYLQTAHDIAPNDHKVATFLEKAKAGAKARN